MQITRIAITVNEIENVGDYSSTRPSVTFDATLAPGEDPAQALYDLFDLGKAQIHAMVDQELMTHGRKPIHYAGPRYAARYNSALKLIVVTPVSMALPGPRWYARADGYPLREAEYAAAKMLEEHRSDGEQGWLLLSWADSDSREEIESLVIARQDAYDAEEERKRQAALVARQQQDMEWEAQEGRKKAVRQAAYEAQLAVARGDLVAVSAPAVIADDDEDAEDDEGDSDEDDDDD